MSEPSANGWNTFGMSRPDKDAYRTRAKLYLDELMPIDIAVIITEYGSSVCFYINRDVDFDNVEYPPRQLPDGCPAEFVRHIRILASVQIQDTICDLLSDITW